MKNIVILLFCICAMLQPVSDCMGAVLCPATQAMAQLSASFDPSKSTTTKEGAYTTVYSSYALKAMVSDKNITIIAPKGYKSYTKKLDTNKYDIGLIFDIRPSTNVFYFDLEDYDKFNYYPIPYLTEQDKKDGKSALPGTEGGIAVFDKSPFPSQRFIVYRSEVTDNKSDTDICSMSVEKKKLKVVINNEWLDTAQYPVELDPTLGTTSILGSANDLDQSYQVRWRAGFMPVDGTATQIALCAWSGSGASVKMALYADDGAGKPGAFIAGSYVSTMSVVISVTPPEDANWAKGAISSSLTAGTTIWIGFVNINEAGHMAFAYQGSGGQWYYKAGDAGGFPQDPAPAGTSQTYIASAYLTYSPIAAPWKRRRIFVGNGL